MKQERKSPKRIIVDVSDELHMKFKKYAVNNNVTMKQAILIALAALFEHEDYEKRITKLK